MIITRTPFRMSFFGGGSDLPAYFKNHGGAVLSTSINKYVYINFHQKFNSGLRIAYSNIEEVTHVNDVRHPIVKNTLNYFRISGGFEISSIADIPSKGSGLGSSSSYTVGLIKAISEYQNLLLSTKEIAELACYIEIELCGDPIGKQDQYAAAFGGFNVFRFSTDGTTTVHPLNLSSSFLHYISASLVSVYTGNVRNAASILKEQSEAVGTGEKASIQSRIVSFVDRGTDLLLSENLSEFGQLLDESWQLKKQLSDKISNAHVDEIYAIGMRAGAWGGKLLGAGMGGFITFIVDPKKCNDVKNALSGYQIVELVPELSGHKLLHNSMGN
ncbi:hypothetical protein N9H20_05350 [Planktomarina temperata]|nr:hypothetical protein [Planktomarina temperata]